MHAFDRQTDGQTDRQTDRRTDRRTEISSLRPRLHSMQRGKMGSTETLAGNRISKWRMACFTGVQHVKDVLIAKATTEGKRRRKYSATKSSSEVRTPLVAMFLPYDALHGSASPRTWGFTITRPELILRLDGRRHHHHHHSQVSPSYSSIVYVVAERKWSRRMMFWITNIWLR